MVNTTDAFIGFAGRRIPNPNYRPPQKTTSPALSDRSQQEQAGRQAARDFYDSIYGPGQADKKAPGTVEARVAVIIRWGQGQGINDVEGLRTFGRSMVGNPDFDAEVTRQNNVYKHQKTADQWAEVSKVAKIITGALTVGSLLTPADYVAQQAAASTIPGTTPTDLAGTITPYQTPTPALPVSTDPYVNAAATGTTQALPGGGTVTPNMTSNFVTPTVNLGQLSKYGTSVDDIADKVLNGTLSWADILKEGEDAAISLIMDKIQNAPKERKEEAWYAGNRKMYEQQANIGRERVSQDYAREMDDLRRSQHIQNLNARQQLAERGITPNIQSSIGGSEWHRLAEEQAADRSGRELLKKRKLEDIGLQLEEAQRRTPQYGESSTSFGEVLKGEAPQLASDIAGDVWDKVT